MQYDENQPVSSLSGFVRCVWTLEGDATEASEDPVFPDGSPELIFNFGDPFVARDSTGEFVAQPSIMLVGQITAPFFVRPSGEVRLVAFRFHPYGATGLYEDMSAITNGWLDMAQVHPQVWSHPGRYRNSTDTLSAIANELSVQLAELLGNSTKPHVDVVRACNEIRDRRGAIVIEDLAAQLGTTVRTLQRRFAAEVGIPPKLLARITRFQHVFTAWRNDPQTLARVAADCGYFDQSHLVRDFRDFAGDAPAAALAAQPEFTSFFLP